MLRFVTDTFRSLSRLILFKRGGKEEGEEGKEWGGMEGGDKE